MNPVTANTHENTLRAALQERLAQFRQQAPAEAMALIDAGNETLERSGLLANSLRNAVNRF